MPESSTSGSVRDRVGKPPGLLDLHSYRKAVRECPPVRHTFGSRLAAAP
jgi:hypothetical protein